MKKKGKGLRFAMIGLGLGMLLGFGILLLKKYIASELIALLDDEASGACDCSFEVDSVHISLLRMKATARNARILERGKPKLIFKTVRADFSAKGISERRLILNHLELIDGYSEGVLADSATFRFIDFLTEAPPPEKQDENRFRIKLMRLTVTNSRFTEDLAQKELIGEGVSLSVTRLPNSHFLLRPLVRTLKLRLLAIPPPLLSARDESTLNLGAVSSKITLKDDLGDFRDLTVAFAQTAFKANITSNFEQDYALEGNHAFKVNSDSHDFIDWLPFKLYGRGEVAGEIDDPQMSGELSIQSNDPVKATPLGVPLPPLTSLRGRYDFDFNGGDTELEISGFEATGNGARIRQTNPITLRGDQIDAPLRMYIDELQLGNYKISGLDAVLHLSGIIGNERWKLSGVVGSLSAENYIARDVWFSVAHDSGRIDLSFRHESRAFGDLNAKGTFLVSEQDTILESLDYTFDNFSLNHFSENEDPDTVELRITGSGTASGPLRLAELDAESELTVSSDHFEGEAALRGKARLEQGILAVEVQNDTGSVDVELDLNILDKERSRLRVALQEFKAKEYSPSLDCVSASAELAYDFSLKEPASGDGTLQLDEFSLGCGAYAVSTKRSYALPVKAGALSLSQFQVVGADTQLELNGDFSLQNGYGIDLVGEFDLATLLPLLPAFDDLKGRLTTSLRLNGPIKKPVLLGKSTIQEGEVAIEAANISVTNVTGALDISQDQVNISEVSGRLNGGQFDISGTIYLLALNQSYLTLGLKHIFIEPLENTTCSFSGDLLLSQNEQNVSVLEGEIVIESAEFERNLDLKTFVRNLPTFFFSRAPIDVPTQRELPVIETNVTISATRNVFVLTNWLSAELEGALTVTGPINSPELSGELSTIAGWFGLKDRRFQITSGAVSFSPSSNDPQLEIISEIAIRSRAGDFILVILEARGPLTAPKITLTSDQGLSQKQILQLLTSAGGITGSTSSSTVIGDVEPGEFDLTNMSFREFFQRLASIDTINLEPDFNRSRGVVEPAVVARKRIFDRLSLVGQTFFSGTDAKLLLEYDMSQNLALTWGAETRTNEQNTDFITDLTYTILSKHKPYLTTVIQGNEEFGNATIRRALRLTDSSKIPANELEKLIDTLTRYYRSQGFFETTVQASCHIRQEDCRHLVLDIEEGPRSLIQSVILNGDSIPPEIQTDDLIQVGDDTTATEQFHDASVRELTGRLRSEGYIAARIIGHYEKSDESGIGRDLVLDVHIGTPVSFSFVGNSAFSAEEFLSTINLFTRRQPFGRNTINILVENIERLYREAGFLYATIHHTSQLDPETGRQNFVIEIEEEQRSAVTEVLFEGLDQISQESLIEHLTEIFDGRFPREILAPDYVIAEQIEANLALLKEIYIEEGFPHSEIDYDIEALQDDRLRIRYIIYEGPELKADWVELHGLPDGFIAPLPPEISYSIPKANRYISQLIDRLKNEGYFAPALFTTFEADQKKLHVHIEAGDRTHVSGIEVIGHSLIEEEVILEHVNIDIGNPWIGGRLRESRIKLLTLGLFSRVELVPLDGKLDSSEEVLLVRVNERALQSLEVGGGISSERGVHLFGEATDRLLFADGRHIGLRFDTYYDDTQAEISEGVANLRFADPNFLDSSFLFTEDLRFQKLDLSTFEFDLDRISLNSNLYRSWESGFTTLLGHTIFREDLKNVSEGAILSDLDVGTTDISYLSGNISYDQRDRPLNPSSGYNLKLDYRVASKGIGSDADYFSIGGTASYLLPFFLSDYRFVFAVQSQAASAWTYSGTPDIPISQRYYLGGRSTVRGFRENSLGPRGDDGSIIGGDLLVLSNAEFRYDLGNSLGVHVFFDTGTVYLKDESVEFDDLRTSTGIGIRYLSPIGPLGFDLGHPLDEKPGEPSVRLHFAIGSTF